MSSGLLTSTGVRVQRRVLSTVARRQLKTMTLSVTSQVTSSPRRHRSTDVDETDQAAVVLDSKRLDTRSLSSSIPRVTKDDHVDRHVRSSGKSTKDVAHALDV